MINRKANILVVEDSPMNIDILLNILKDDYTIYVAINSDRAFSILSKRAIDLILLDIVLPGMSGTEIMQSLQENKKYKSIPVIFLSSINDPKVKTECFEAGAIDYITKPYNSLEIKERIKTRIKLIEANQILSKQKNVLEEMIRLKTDEIIRTRDAAMIAVSSLVETRDSDTGEHINRTQKFVLVIAETLNILHKYPDILNEEYILELERASTLHDIGKIGIPDYVLLKPGKLTDEEFEIIKKHPRIGYNALKKASLELGDNLFFNIACDIALYHHEKWNGRGYPEGLSGDDIPLSARIMALSDVYDALTSERVYKKRFSHQKAMEIIKGDKGVHFDPNVVDAFLISEKLFEKTAFQSKNEEVFEPSEKKEESN